MAETTTTNNENKDLQKIERPDGKYQYFKKSWSKDRIDKYFTKQGWVKKADGWYSQDGQKAKMGVPGETPTGITEGNVGHRVAMRDTRKDLTPSVSATGSLGALPTVLGAVGGFVGKTPGAALGGAVGEGFKQLSYRILYNNDISDKQATINVLKEAAIQAGLEKGGQYVGQGIFKILDKVPHAKLIEKIPFLPSEYKQGGKLYKYVEDLFANLIPSSKKMEDFRATQGKAIDEQLEVLVKSMGHFKGTSADMGELLQGAVRQSNKDALKSLESMVKAKGFKTVEELYKTAEYKEYEAMFRNSLVRKIGTTESPSLIAGFIRNKNIGTVENVSHLVGILGEKNPTLLKKAQASLMQDFITEAIKGSTDPVAKNTVKGQFTGAGLKKVLDGMGEERLKALYGQEGYNNIENFVALTSRIGTSSNGAGRFMNLAFLLPFRNGISLKGGGKLGVTALVINRMAKVITSQEGMKLYQKEIEAGAKQLPRLANLAREEIKAFNERSDREYEIQKEQEEEEYQKEKEKYNK